MKTKRRRSTAPLALLLALAVSLTLCPAAAYADDYHDPYLGQGHSKEDIIARWDALRPIGSGTAFATEPITAGPGYASGALNGPTLGNGANTWNFARWLAGLNDVGITDASNQLMAKGALLNAINDTLTHTPSLPGDMLPTDPIWLDGQAACGQANLYSGSPVSMYNDTSLMSNSVQTWLNDSDEYNVTSLGHRRWMLYPQLATSGFGGAYSGNWLYTACQVSGTPLSSAPTPATVSWPAPGYFPIEFFAGGQAWSVSLGPGYQAATSGISVTMAETDDGTRASGGSESFTSFSTSGTKIFTVSTDGFGTPNCVIFRPSTLVPGVGKAYRVTVSGLRLSGGAAAPDLVYDVAFFSLDEDPPAPMPTIAIDSQPTAETTVTAGSITGSLNVQASVSDGSEPSYQWYSSDSASNSGGSAIDGAVSPAFAIPTTLSGGDYYYYCLVSASGATSVPSSVATVHVNSVYVAVGAVSLSEASMTMDVGDLGTLTATVTPANASDKTVSWSSSNTSVAAVDSTGGIQALAYGSATITVTTTDGGFTATCALTVRAKQTLSVTASAGGSVTGDASGIYYVGDSLAVGVEAASGFHFVGWTAIGITVADPSAASLSFTMPNNAVTLTANFEADPYIAVEGVSLNASTLTLDVGDAHVLQATITPAGATNKAVTWSSSNVAVATVDAYGRVELLSIGSATITVTAVDGGLSASCQFTVRDKHLLSVSSGPYGSVAGTASGIYYVGDGITLNAQPASGYHFVRWTGNGITLTDTGAATISFSMPNNAVTLSASFAPDHPVTNVHVTPPRSTTVTVGQTLVLSATVFPGNATDPTVIWTSSDPTVATVDAVGRVTALKAGKVTITATTREGGFSSAVVLTIQARATTPPPGGQTPGTGDPIGLIGWGLVAALTAAALAVALYVRHRRRQAAKPYE
jgi:uncharacterized protein YjdB